MNLKLTQFSQKPASRSRVCARCGYRMFQTKRFKWLCGPGCDGAQLLHEMEHAHQIPGAYSVEKDSLTDQSIH